MACQRAGSLGNATVDEGNPRSPTFLKTAEDRSKVVPANTMPVHFNCITVWDLQPVKAAIATRQTASNYGPVKPFVQHLLPGENN